MRTAAFATSLVLFAFTSAAVAEPYNLNGYWVEVDYWAGAGPNETILVIDWNDTNGPYETEAHAWGYRWSGNQYVSDAVMEICAAGPLTVTTSYGGAFLNDAFYCDPTIDPDQHTSAGYSGWWWCGSTSDGGVTWVSNGGGINTEPLDAGVIEGFNMDSGNWTSATLTIPVPEPASLGLLLLGVVGLGRRRRRVQ